MTADRFATERATIAALTTALMDKVAAACPSPHNPVKRRDRNPSWCEVCRRTALGVLIPAKTSEQDTGHE